MRENIEFIMYLHSEVCVCVMCVRVCVCVCVYIYIQRWKEYENILLK